MATQFTDTIEKAYQAFNERNIDAVLLQLHKDVHWPNGWEGGYVKGHDEVRAYWTRQWKELDPKVNPVSFKERENGKIEVDVAQIVKDINGAIVFNGLVKHIYTFEEEKIKSMEIEKI